MAIRAPDGANKQFLSAPVSWEKITIQHIFLRQKDVIKTADWLVDLGPEGGDGGGEIIGCGSPEDISKIKTSYTGKYLKKILKN